MCKKIYNEIQNQIIEMLENSLKLDYKKAWFSVGNLAQNPVSDTFYTGFNQLYLSFTSNKKNYTLNKWLTFKQSTELKALIKKGEKATPVVYYNKIYKNKNGETISQQQVQNLINETGKTLSQLGISCNGFLKFYYVFNVAQISGLPESFYQPDNVVLSEIEKIENAELLLSQSKAIIEHKLIDEAYYIPAKDIIVLPLTSQFLTPQLYYSTAFHELSHWTGATHRLNRTFGNKFGNEQYAFEELVAELSAALVCGSLHITKDFTNNAAYLQSWIKALKKDINIFFKAAALAQKSADYILSFNTLNKQAA
jgi:antirestriction protein ArdC